MFDKLPSKQKNDENMMFECPLNVLVFSWMFSFSYSNFKGMLQMLHKGMLQTLWEWYFGMFLECSETCSNISKLSEEHPTKTFPKKLYDWCINNVFVLTFLEHY